MPRADLIKLTNSVSKSQDLCHANGKKDMYVQCNCPLSKKTVIVVNGSGTNLVTCRTSCKDQIKPNVVVNLLGLF